MHLAVAGRRFPDSLQIPGTSAECPHPGISEPAHTTLVRSRRLFSYASCACCQALTTTTGSGDCPRRYKTLWRIGLRMAPTWPIRGRSAAIWGCDKLGDLTKMSGG